jgi:hypothetical protein
LPDDPKTTATVDGHAISSGPTVDATVSPTVNMPAGMLRIKRIKRTA